jgi:hypothetical protein
MATLQELSRSWQLTREFHTLEQGVIPWEIEAFEKEVGWKLPNEWREFYEYTNGIVLFKWNLKIGPLLGGESSFANHSKQLRQFDWPIPDELWIAGSDGEGYPFGLWHPAANAQAGPIVELDCGDDYEPGVVATSLNAFLLFRTVDYLLYYYSKGEPVTAALEVLSVPRELWPREPIDEIDSDAIRRWADPDYRDYPFDPFELEKA